LALTKASTLFLSFSVIFLSVILGSSVLMSDYITTLGVTLDSNLTLNKHVSSVCKSPRHHTGLKPHSK